MGSSLALKGFEVKAAGCAGRSAEIFPLPSPPGTSGQQLQQFDLAGLPSEPPPGVALCRSVDNISPVPQRYKYLFGTVEEAAGKALRVADDLGPAAT